MCATCGCSDGGVRVIDLRPAAADQHTPADGHSHSRSHDHDHYHDHPHSHDHPLHRPGGDTETITLETRVLAKNDELAEQNRRWLATRGVVAINLMSSPGSGKTTVLEQTVRTIAATTSVCVIEGDQETTLDAERIHAAGAPVLQVNTGSGCHLDAAMMRDALHTLDPTDGLVLIENVGNLVCPALFDLGEAARVVIMSVTEGADKPLKYPNIFATATLVLLNKIDLLPYVDFDLARFGHDVRIVKPGAEILHVSATRGDRMGEWIDWLRRRSVEAAR